MAEVTGELLLIILLIIANGFFAISEISLVAARKSRINQMADSGNRRAQIARKLQEDPNRFLATVQIGITLVGTLAAVVGGAKVVKVLEGLLLNIRWEWVQNNAEGLSIAAVVVAISYLSLVIGELFPKYIAIMHAEKVATSIAIPVNLLSKLARVFVILLTASSQGLARIFGVKSKPETAFASEEEVKYIIQEGTQKGIFEQHEHQYIHSIFEFTDKLSRQVMTPRTDIVAVEINTPQDKILQVIMEEGFSRIPVYQENIDNIVGVIFARDIINLLLQKDLFILTDIIRQPCFVPDSKKISEVLREFQKRKIHLAIVLDEFGGTAGLITLEDIIEEIVGEILDEYDSEEAKEVDQLPDGTSLVKATIQIEDFNRIFGTRLPVKPYDTLSGLIINSLERIPAVDEKVHLHGMDFQIYQKSGHRLEKIQVKFKPKSEQ
ncbi:MAG: hemolysin family protein [candidate division Zixibacteria bacterium]|nr:hemolysin family protein [candidate division Zixibacteria bacterium]